MICDEKVLAENLSGITVANEKQRLNRRTKRSSQGTSTLARFRPAVDVPSRETQEY
jgi:hypothetical protein